MEEKYRIVEMEFIDFILDKLYENPVQVNITFPESNMLISREGSTDLADQQWLRSGMYKLKQKLLLLIS